MTDELNLTDDKTLEMAIQGDTDAFSSLYEHYVERIYNYIFYRIGNTVDAEDLTAKVFYRALGRITSYKSMGVPFSAWLYRIAHNLVANWYRDNSRRQEVPLDDQPSLHLHSVHPEMSLMEDQEKEWLLTLIKKLPQDRQELLILKFVDRLSNSEIALIMGRSEGAIKSLYHRTLLVLRDELEKKV
jgi:RNA polymerase sigma-70 factor, ECF subfamily